MTINIKNIKRFALLCSATLALTSCLKDKPFPLYGDKAVSQKFEYTYDKTADTLQDKTYAAYLSTNGNYFVQNNQGNTQYNYWPQAHTLDAFTDAYLRTKSDVYKQRMKSLLTGTYKTNGNKYENLFYDDMEWLALASLRAYQATNDADYLTAAKTLWTDIKTGKNDQQGGGIAWNKDKTGYKNTPANAPAIIFAARLYQLEKNQADLDIAKELYTWLKSTLLDGSGIIWDGINGNGDGAIDKNKYTYNQGVFMGAALELYNATGDAAYLNDAIANATATIKDLDMAPGGLLRNEGQGDGGLFKGILVRYLTLLTLKDAVPATTRDTYAAFLKYNSETLFAKGISRPDFFVGSDWKTKPSATDATDLTTQISGLTTIEAAATLKAAGKF
ncbi:MAG: hypothetical protein JKY70_10345 [Mucilaginibacter sp.]|nr:hypothetical protein [Mucilaginibacter sp.]